MPGWETYLKFCRQGFTGRPLTGVFDIADLKPECLHAVIKSVALLADLGETLSLLLPTPIELAVELDKEGMHKPTSGMQSTTRMTKSVWKRLLSPGQLTYSTS
jgi:hypothetical protein